MDLSITIKMANPKDALNAVEKKLWISEEELLQFAANNQTPFYIYDEENIRSNCRILKQAFSWVPGFSNYFAVKATPNPAILKIIKEEGFGADCSSLAELKLAKMAGFSGSEIFFTSNNTVLDDFEKAVECGAIVNLDDIHHLQVLKDSKLGVPETLAFRYNPGKLANGNRIIGIPEQSKFGMTRNQILEGVKKAQGFGVRKFILHSMIVSNCLQVDDVFNNAKLLMDFAAEIFESTGITISTINMGGGLGIPYFPDQDVFPVDLLAQKIKVHYNELIRKVGMKPFSIVFECGRFITGPSGILVSRIINKKSTYKNFLGVDACMANLMRPGMYDAYHQIIAYQDANNRRQSCSSMKENNRGEENNGTFDVVGSLCENNDKFAKDRFLGSNVEIGDLLIICDTGAHGHSMGFNYNGRLKCPEYLRTSIKDMKIIRRAETLEDYFSTLIF